MKLKTPYIILVAGLLLTSCEGFLEVKPDNAFTIEETLNTPQDAREYLNAAYDALSYGSVLGGQFSLISELMADGVDGDNLNGDWFAHYTRSTDIFLGTTRGMMADGYRAVGRANNVLDQLDLIDGLSDADKRTMEGEVKFIRSLIHFDMVRFFGQPYGYTADNSHLGVVLRTSQNTEILNRSTVGEVYAQIIADLEDAATLLPENNDIYANAWAAKALLAKVHFQMNDFKGAFDYADDVILNGPYSFDGDFRARYGFGVSNEVIFGLISTDIDADNANGGYRGYFRPDPSNLGEAGVYPSSDLVNAFQVEPDNRFTAWFETGANGRPYCKKFHYDTIYTNPVLHLTELKLIRAESAIEEGNNEAGRLDINDIRTRAGMTELAPGSATASLILRTRDERRKELYFENNRMHELKRQALRDTPGLLIRNAPWDCAGMVCQIPDNELKGNPNMEPNPQGGCD